MKIVITINTTWNIFNFRLGLIKALQQKGHTVLAVSPTDDYKERLEQIGVKHYHITMNSKGTNPLEDYKVIKSYKNIYSKIKPDVILSYTIKPNIYGNIAANKLDIPVINNVSGLGTLFIKQSLSSVIGKILYKIAFRKSSWVFFQNNTDKSLFTNSKLVNEEITSVLPGSGVNTKIFSTIRNDNKGINFLFVGRLIGDKGIREYIYAAKKLSEKYNHIYFNIVGELGYANKTAITKDELENWLNTPQIKFLGKQDDMVSVLNDVDIMVLPSYREGLSKSLIEAASMSLPIVTTDVPGCREVVEHGKNGFLCKSRDEIDLKNKMEQMILLSETERLEMGRNGRVLAETVYDENIVIENYILKIKDILT